VQGCSSPEGLGMPTFNYRIFDTSEGTWFFFVFCKHGIAVQLLTIELSITWFGERA
jgi:hypothetical protein